MKLYNKIKLKGLMMVTIISLINSVESVAQLSPMGAVYYQNQYLINPSMAGAQEGLRMDLGYSSQQTNMPGSPKTQIMTMGYRVNKVGMGLNVMIDQAGLISRTRVMGTYAYHLPLNNDNGNLRFGLSLGLLKDRLTGDLYNGEQGDVSVARFNERPAYIDGDFGATYEKKALTIQVAVPNLRSFFRSEDTFNANSVNQSNLFSAVSYKISLSEQMGGIGLEPKLCYRGFTGFDDIVDLGTNVTLLDEKISFMTMYHSSKNVSLGFGSKLNSMFHLNAVYRTGSAAFNGNTNGDFEINLRLNLNKKESK